MATLRTALAVLTVLVVGCTNEPAPREPTAGIRVEGDVLEQIDGPPYSYLRILTDEGEVWAAVPVTRMAGRNRATVVNGVVLRQYQARAIGRRFEAVVFGTLETR